MAQTARSTPGRLHGLLAAHHLITSDLRLSATLERVVSASCDLVAARCGALGVIGAHDGLERFVQHGMDEQQALRVAACFPPRAPLPMKSIVVPIQVSGAVFGHLYLADPADGSFSDEDEELVTALAATAGIAIQNARLYDEVRRSNAWLQASGEITRGLLENADVDVVFEVVNRILEAARADSAAIVLPSADGKLTLVATAGVGADRYRGHTLDPAVSSIGQAICAGKSILIADLGDEVRADYDNVYNLGPAMSAPLVDALGTRGAVLLTRTRGHAPFEVRDIELATTFAAQVAVALRFDDARADAERLRMFEDRDVVAQDLNDNVLQRLFATGVGLQSLAELPLGPLVAARLSRYIADLDDTIEQLRNRVADLRAANSDTAARADDRFPRVARAAVDDD